MSVSCEVGVGLPPVPCDHAVTETVSAVVGVVPEQPTQVVFACVYTLLP